MRLLPTLIRLAVCAASATSLAVLPAGTPPAQTGVWIEDGAYDCGEWLAARKAGTASYLEGYVLGVVNGFALAQMKDFWRADGTLSSRDAFYLSIDNYCALKPFDKLTFAVANVFRARTETKR